MDSQQVCEHIYELLPMNAFCIPQTFAPRLTRREFMRALLAGNYMNASHHVAQANEMFKIRQAIYRIVVQKMQFEQVNSQTHLDCRRK